MAENGEGSITDRKSGDQLRRAFEKAEEKYKKSPLRNRGSKPPKRPHAGQETLKIDN